MSSPKYSYGFYSSHVKIYRNGVEVAEVDKSEQDRKVTNPKTGRKIELFNDTWYKLLRSDKYIIDSEGNFIPKLKFKHLGTRARPTLTFKRRKGLYRVSIDVEFEHKRGGAIQYDWHLFSFTIESYVLNTRKQRLETVEKVFQIIKDKGKEYEESATGQYRIGEFNRLDDGDNRAIDFDMLPMRSRRFKKLDQWYGFSFDVKENNNYLSNYMCVINYLMQVSDKSKHRKHNHLNINKLEKEFKSVGIDIHKDAVTAADLVEWWKQHHMSCCSLYVLDGLMRIKHTHHPTRKDPYLSFVIIDSNYHCYGITNGSQKKKVTNKQCDTVSVEIVRKTRYQFCVERTMNQEDRQALIDGEYMPEHDIIFDGNKYYPDESKGEWVEPTLDQLFVDLIINGNVIPYGMELNRSSQLVSFCHPKTQQVISISEDFRKREQMCRRLFEQVPIHQFKFNNQSYAQLSESIFLHYFGEVIQPCHYSRKTQEIITDFCTSPLMCGVTEFTQRPDFSSHDCKCSYPNAILSIPDDEKIPMFDVLDRFNAPDGKLEPGYYLLDIVKHWWGGVEKRQIATQTYVKYLLKRGVIKHEHILRKMKASLHVTGKQVKAFALKVKELFPDVDDPSSFSREARVIIINWIGKMGQSVLYKRRACFTQNPDEVTYFHKTYGNKGTMAVEEGLAVEDRNVLKVNQLTDGYIVDCSSKELLLCDYAPIMRHIYCRGKMQTLKMIDDLYIPGVSTICTVRTDGVCGWNLRQNHGNPMYAEKSVTPMKPQTIPVQPLPPLDEEKEWNYLPDIHFVGRKWMRIDGKLVGRKQGLKVLDGLIGKSMLLHGDGGNQKSTIIKYIMKQLKKRGITFKVVVKAHRAAGVLKKGLEEELQGDVMVLDSFFHPGAFRETQDQLIVDEVSQLGMPVYRKLIREKEKGTVLLFSGDFCQTGMINGEGHLDQKGTANRHYNLMERQVFRQLVDFNIMEKKFYPDCCRNRGLLNSVVQAVKETGHVPSLVSDEQMILDVNLCYFTNAENSTKNQVNRRIMKEKGIALENYHQVAGVRVCGKKNKGKLFNGQKYVTLASDNSNAMIQLLYQDKEEEPAEPFEVKKTDLDVAFCDGVHKSQGDKIDEPGLVWDLERMSRNELVTALGRFTNLEYIHLKWKDANPWDTVAKPEWQQQYFPKYEGTVLWSKRFFPWLQEPEESTELSITPSKIGYIYRMVWESQRISYVGMTTRKVDKRMAEHDQGVRVEKYGGNYRVEELAKACYVRSTKHLKDVETYYIRDDIWFGEYENDNKDQTSGARKRRVKHVELLLSKEKLYPMDEEELAKARAVIDLRKTDTWLRCSISGVQKQHLKTAFGRKEMRYKRRGVEEAEAKLTAQAVKYLEKEGVTEWRVWKNY